MERWEGREGEEESSSTVVLLQKQRDRKKEKKRKKGSSEWPFSPRFAHETRLLDFRFEEEEEGSAQGARRRERGREGKRRKS